MRLVVVGNGMVGHRFLEILADRAAAGTPPPFEVTVIGEEPRAAYDRVGLSTFFDGKSADDLSLVRPGQYEAAGLRRADWATARTGASTANAASSQHPTPG